MPPTLILVRHAQALHNVDKDYDIPDPDLSLLGLEQCKPLRESLMNSPLAQQAGLVVVSPMRRTIQTALRSVDWLLDKGVKIEADADWQENSAKPCDTGSDVAKVAVEYPQVDYSSLDPVFPDKTSSAASRYHYSRPALLARAQAALEKLYNRPEKVIIVVSHSGFMRLAVTGCWFFNADYRIFEFAPMDHVSVDTSFRLQQASITKESGGGLGWSRSEELVLGSELPEEYPPPEPTVKAPIT
ncbi:histidine phosphatase superfamily [Microdochium trichocladiopsis]|uniref:Histidine phosphatase superfamily n=1 Tax=Microdochium trichocladiopsis TaxID=1682393 RepID=A0A9P8Y6C1_9PEZI|nr:histidine phosphatase superfamily [Microdochium trichocladiopsis]KAH7030777.1 histidine phosphatase superfamily [Microdochium trichocladiopsis]